MSAQIVLLRHAEKPDDNDRADLSLRGRIRAAALAVFLPDHFGRPNQLIATKASRESDRPALTLKPLSQSLGLAIDTRFEDAEFKQLAKVLADGPIYKEARIVICWHHGTIPQFASALGVHDAPDHWDEDVFDRIWQIDGFPDAPALTRLHQKLLHGDRD